MRRVWGEKHQLISIKESTTKKLFNLRKKENEIVISKRGCKETSLNKK